MRQYPTGTQGTSLLHMGSSWGEHTAPLGRLEIGEGKAALAAATDRPPIKEQGGS